MKQNLKTMLATFAVVILASSGFAYAEEKPAAADSHEQHHPEGQAKDKKEAGGMGGGMMGSMKMDDMMGMMEQCMSMHKDGKMCDHEAMQKCQENMKKGECGKMMKQAKAKGKEASKEKVEKK